MIPPVRLRLIQITVLVIATLLATYHLGEAQNKAKLIDDLMQKYYQYGQFNGTVLVAEQGKVVFKKGYGEANKEWNIPNTPDTKFRLGSITKQFTSMLILQLVDEGKIKVEGKLTDYIPEYPKAAGDKVTVYHLLTHTSGIPSYTSMPDFNREYARNPYAPTDFIKFFWDLPLEFEPGTKFVYNNSGYFLLGVIIEKVTGKAYAQVLEERIFQPLGMKNSGYDLSAPVLTKRAAGYEKRSGGFVNASYVDMTLPYAAGALYSTVEDLFLWDQALTTGRLLSKESVEALFTPRIPMSSRPGAPYYAYGWSVGKVALGKSQDSVSTIGHGGGINGFNTLLTRVPDMKTFVVLLNNTGGAQLGAMTQSILGILYGKPYAEPKRSIAEAIRDAATKSGTDAARQNWNDLRQKKEEYYLSEGEMNSLGYEFLQQGKLRDAIEIFKMNVEAFPNSFNVYDSLGEAYAAAGQKELAIKNYEKSLELNPQSRTGIEALKKLKPQ
ncbi:MAG: tetratricopeptide repeat protein [Ignavibacteria bacterium]|nr:tetratricopeptide repeat protein [Ignavibacteria bacterium]